MEHLGFPNCVSYHFFFSVHTYPSHSSPPPNEVAPWGFGEIDQTKLRQLHSGDFCAHINPEIG